MSPKRSHKSGRRPRRRGEQTRRERRRASAPAPPDLMATLDQTLKRPHPLPLLDAVSSIVAALDPRRQNPFAPTEGPTATVEEIIESFIEVDLPATTAALQVLAVLAADDLTAVRIRRAVAGRRHALPSWLDELGDVAVYRAVEMSHVLGDGDDVILGARLVSGHELSALVYVDHNMGTVVKDAFLVDQPVSDLLTLMQRSVADQGTTFVDLPLPDAGAKVVEALETGLRMWPPLESDTWPLCRPLVEWLVRAMPAGGSGWQRAQWTDQERQQLAEDFLASPYGSGRTDADRRSLLASLLWFGTDYANGDPLRWSPVSVELLLTDWIPRKLVADAAYLSAAPELLRAFISFAHDRTGIAPDLTRETLSAIDAYEPEYQRLIRSPRLQGPEALLAAAGLLHDGEDELESYQEIMLAACGRAVGGRHALEALDDELLPDEAFDSSQLPADIQDRVAEVLLLVDGCCEELLDTEYRTACRRLLADVAAGDPAVFRRAGAARTAAAAICWIIGKANDAFDSWGSGLEVQEMMTHFGLAGSVSQRAGTMLKAVGIAPNQYGAMDLGSPRYLVSSRRRQLLERRDRYVDPADASLTGDH